MKISGRPLFWFLIALTLFLFWKAPQTMSNLLSGIGGLFVGIGNGVAQFLGQLTA